MKGIAGSSPQCSVEGCDRISRAKGLCSKHYAKIRQTGTLEKIMGTPEWIETLRQSHAHLKSKVSLLDTTQTKDTRKGQKGSLAAKIVSQIKADAKKGGYDWNLTSEEVFSLIINPCKYCGAGANWPNSRNGIDRVDSSIGYHINNCVTACFSCNAAKGNKSVAEFMDWAKRLCINNNLIK